MQAVTTLVQSTVGRKVVMAATGLAMLGWLFLHTLGNLQAFLGQESFNHYAEFIQSGFGVEPALLWFMRAFMLALLGLHVWAAITLRRRIAAARPVAYQGGQTWQRTKLSSRLMMVSGLVILAYLVFHLAHLTVGVFSNDAIQGAAFERHNAYKNLVVGLGNPAVAALYVVANVGLGAHLHHAVDSGFQTLGVNHPSYNGARQVLGTWLPVFVAGGNVLLAIAIVLGLGIEPPH